MTYKISITTRVSVTADTAEEIRRICDGWMPPRPVQIGPEKQCEAIPGPQESVRPAPPPAGPCGQDPPALDEAITAYLFNLEAAGRSKCTLRSYRQHLNDLARFLEGGGVHHVAQVDVNHLRAYLGACQRAGLLASTIKTRCTISSCFFNWCVQEGTISENPMRRVRRPKRTWRSRPTFTEGEFLAILAAAEQSENPIRNKAILYLLLDTGMRTSELMSLQSHQYDRAKSAFVINGKGNKIRTVKMGMRCQAAFEAHLERTNGRLWDISIWSFRSLIYRLGKKAGVKVNPHKFRHTFSSSFLDAGGTIDELQYLLGHSDISTTMIYTAAGQEKRALRSHQQHSPLDALRAT